jgi:hypothetical protein
MRYTIIGREEDKMDKKAMIQSICQQYSSMGIPYKTGTGTDIYIKTEFLDAGFSTGSKKITYEAMVCFDEANFTAFMWEKTTETGHGISFGGSGGTAFQSGKTLFRKVKSIQYAPDGKAYEYSLDLGAIPKAVKKTAIENGWKFKTVLKREKAQYPAGHVFASDIPIGDEVSHGSNGCDTVQQTQYADKNGTFYAKGGHQAKKSRNRVINNIGLVVFAVFIIVFFLLAEASAAGMLMAAAVLLIQTFLTNKLAQKGCLAAILIWVLSLIAILLIFTYNSGAAGTA